MNNIKIGEYRLVPQGTAFWSINNQTNLISTKDEIVEIKHTCFADNLIFVKPKQLLFNTIGSIPTLIGKGTDEWELSYSQTLPYTIPEPQFLNY
jgi:hypothetical protein